MILEGNERGNGAELAQHLTNARDNEHVSVHAINGFVADDLSGAFAEIEAIANATQCQKYLFSLSLNPPLNAKVPVETFEEVAARIAKSLGLDGQPYTIVFHEKNGRRHAHCVWSRIDTGRMKAVPLPHYKRKLMCLSRELYIEHGWEMPAGFEDWQKRDPLNFSREESGQAKRVKRDAQALKTLFQQCWRQSDSRPAFAAALWAEGYCLARGDRRGFVAVDAAGEVYSLSRWCSVRTKELRARLGDPMDLPNIDEAQALFIARSKEGVPDKTATDTQFKARLDDLIACQRSERDELLRAQEKRRITETCQRQKRLPTGMRLIWARISGAHDRLLNELGQETNACDARDRDERQTLIDRHLNERRALEHSHQSHDLSVELESAFAKALRPDPRQYLSSPQEDLPFTLAQLRRNPVLILSYISEKQARFTETDIKRALAKFVDDPLMLRNGIDITLASEELVPLTSSGAPDYTTRDYQRAEAALFQTATTMATHQTNTVRSSVLADRIATQNARMQRNFGGQLSEEQENALRHICGGTQLSCVVGLAGAGKSTMLEVASAAWNRQGIKVHGAALSGKATDGLRESSGIESRTLASLELSWKNGSEPINRGDVLVVDEAGMIGTRQLSRITNKLNQVGAKLVLVGDPDQLQPIEAGQPFRYLIEHVEAARLTEIHRQKEDWQKLASRDLAAGRLQDALNAYDQHGAVHRSGDQKEVLASLIEHYMSDIETHGTDRTRLAVTHRRKDVFALNQAIRSALRHSDQIEEQEVLLETETGPRAFVSGERIVFTANDKELGVRNGMLGTIECVTEPQITVRLDGHEQTCITFDPRRYRSFDHGYAVTVHKSQGATVDQAYVLASRTLDASLTYVAMTRHREQLRFFVNEKDKPKWMRPQSRQRIRQRNRLGPST